MTTDTRKTFGHYPKVALADARRKAQGLIAKMAEGELDRPSDLTFALAASEWFEKDQGQNRRVHDVRRAFDHDVIPAFQRRRVNEIKRSDVNRLLDRIMERGAGVQANRTLAYLRRFFNWCMQRDYVSENPTSGIKRPYQERPRDRVLTFEEISSVVTASRQLGYPFGPLFEMLLLTGQRKSEVSGARWSELDLKDCTWTIPSERSKNRHPHVVHLSQAAIDLLYRLPKFEGQDLLFSTKGDRPVSGFSKAKRRVDMLSAVSDWGLHDLRRSFATHLTQDLGVSPVVADKILNHQSGAVRGIAAVYQRGQYLTERRVALEAWGRRLEEFNEIDQDATAQKEVSAA